MAIVVDPIRGDDAIIELEERAMPQFRSPRLAVSIFPVVMGPKAFNAPT
jgi:hypothetical protein